MQRFDTRILGVDRGSLLLFSDFKDDGEMWSGTGPRETRRAVAFSEPFRALPVVSVGLSMWDIDSRTNQRADVSAEEVTPTGFTIVFRTWGDTRVARVRADWLAIGALADGDVWQLE